MRGMLREKRSISTEGCAGTAGGAGGAGAGGAGGTGGAACSAALIASAHALGVAAFVAVSSSMRFLPGPRFVLRTLVLGFVILFGINLFEAILADTEVVVHCSVNLTCS